MTPPNQAMVRVEKKLDELGAGMTSILERLASIEATSKAEASERATIHHYTQQALDGLAKRIDDVDAVKRAVYETERDTMVARIETLETRSRQIITGLLFPIAVIVIGAVLVAIIVGH